MKYYLLFIPKSRKRLFFK